MATWSTASGNLGIGGLAHALGELWERVERTERGYTWLSKLIPAYFFGLVAAAKLFALGGLVNRLPVEGPSLAFAVLAAYLGFGGLFFALVAALYVLRRRPQRRVSGPVPGAVALVGAYVMMPVAVGGNLTDDFNLLLIGDLLMAVGTSGAAFALLSLGRCFGIFPEARGLVTGGPYRLVRHPMYLFEFAAFLGVLLPALTPTNISLFVIFVASQLGRMHFEERVLSLTFPEYANYCRRTARLFPGLY